MFFEGHHNSKRILVFFPSLPQNSSSLHLTNISEPQIYRSDENVNKLRLKYARDWARNGLKFETIPNEKFKMVK